MDENLKREIWNKALVVEGYDGNIIRKDPCGAWIKYDNYGDKNSSFGWGVDYIYPKSKLKEKEINDDLIENIINKRPMQWMNLESKSDDYPDYNAQIVAKDDKNEIKDMLFTVSDKVQEQLNNFFGDNL